MGPLRLGALAGVRCKDTVRARIDLRYLPDRGRSPTPVPACSGGSGLQFEWRPTSFLAFRDEKDTVDFVHLDELYLDALAACSRKVLAHVVGADRKLAVAAVGDDRELDAGRAAVIEERLDRGADRAARVEDVVDEDAGAALEREVEAGLADERLRVEGRLAGADVDVAEALPPGSRLPGLDGVR